MAKNIRRRADDYAQWYLDVIKAARLADYAPVRGCMVIRPEGYAIWEAIQRQLDRRFQAHGRDRAHFPLLDPLNLLPQGAEHLARCGLACPLVTHSRPDQWAKRPDPPPAV